MIWRGEPGICEVMAAGERFWRVTGSDIGVLITGRWGRLRASAPWPAAGFADCKAACEHFERKLALLDRATALRIFPGSMFSEDRAIAAWHQKLYGDFFRTHLLGGAA